MAMNCPHCGKELPKKQKKSAVLESRYQQFVEALNNGYKRRRWEFAFNARDGKALKTLLNDRPFWDVETFLKCLKNYFSSEKTPPGGPPYVYLTRLPRYLYGPLNEYGKMLKSEVTMAEDTTHYA